MEVSSKNILILGASYGSLLASKLIFAGHCIQFVCLEEEAQLINLDGFSIRLPIKSEEQLFELNSRTFKDAVHACDPGSVDVSNFDLAILAMQEPQYGEPSVSALMKKLAASDIPCLSVMNMPPLPFLRRFSTIDVKACQAAYSSPTAWDGFNPDVFTHCSPDPQAFRPPGEKSNVLQVRLPANFKIARFPNAHCTTLLHHLASDIKAIRFNHQGQNIRLPVLLRIFESPYVALAKWPILITGNYRCMTDKGMRSISEAVHANLADSQKIYESVTALCLKLGATEKDLVPFKDYCKAALNLTVPSSAVRALNAGEKNIERFDKLLQIIATQLGLHFEFIDEIVEIIDLNIEKNNLNQGPMLMG